jgi:hypothetical protein
LFAQGAARDGETTYDVICRGIADDPGILGLIGEAPVRQRRPNLLLAAVHFLLLRGTAHPLADHYDTVCSVAGGGDGPIGAGAGHPDPDLVADFKDFVMVHRAELLALIAARSTQTNEVGRCTALLPALATIAAGYPDGQPLWLLDLGTSAGLNLLFDSYAYTYRPRSDSDSDGAALSAGRSDALVHLDCAVRGELRDLPALDLPPIAGRTGIDALPIDPTSEDGADWLLACLWPDNLPRFDRLRGALATARLTADPPTVYRGDIIDDLPGVVEGIDADTDGPLVVFHSWVAAYLSPERQAQLVETVRALSHARPLHYLYAESPIETPGLPTPPSPSPSSTSHLATAVVHIAPDGSPPVRLADMHHHGKWLRWWPTPTDPTGRHAGPAPAPPRR